MNPMFRLGCFCFFCLIGCHKVPGTGYYENESSKRSPRAKQQTVAVVVLNNGIVSEFPRRTFKQQFASEIDFSERLSRQLQTRVKSSETEGPIKIVKSLSRIKGLKNRIRKQLLEDGGGHLISKQDFGFSDQADYDAVWVILDWEYKVDSHVSATDATLYPGSASFTFRLKNYGYYQIDLFGALVNEKGEVLQYVSTSAREKYFQFDENLPLDALMGTVADRFARMMRGRAPAKKNAVWPLNFYRI